MQKKASVCPYCGAKKKPLYRRWLFYLILLFVAAAVAIGIIAAVGSSEPKEVKAAKQMSKSTFLAACNEYKYRGLLRNSENYYGMPIKVQVQVHINQNIDGSSYQAFDQSDEDLAMQADDILWDMESDPADYYNGGDYILFDYRETPSPKIVEGDIITVYGIYLGKQTVSHVIDDFSAVPNKRLSMPLSTMNEKGDCCKSCSSRLSVCVN